MLPHRPKNFKWSKKKQKKKVKTKNEQKKWKQILPAFGIISETHAIAWALWPCNLLWNIKLKD